MQTLGQDAHTRVVRTCDLTILCHALLSPKRSSYGWLAGRWSACYHL